MIRALWVARTGLDAQQTHLDVISNNLANVSTNGFKRSRAVFEDLLYQTVRQPGAQSSQNTQIPSGLQIGTGARPVAAVRIHSQGNLQQTNNALDLAIQGDGFFQIQMPDGTIGYTRDGSFQRDSQGQMVTANGYLIDPTITIPADALSISVAKDGTVSITQPGNNNAVQIGNIQLANFVNPSGLQSSGENLYLETASSGAPTVSTPGTNGTGVINQSFVETSNVNIAEELVSMIEAQRAYEINSRVVSTADQMLARLTQL
ncbi:MAG: flagellar basal-body rod protein FlgG [Candidatus Dactylopiibacterium carminicum]|uniref:Flagellar basal-body rod protein FlgG n=1 Tax=Candidatus Dactylopiibacterium carminicum TaxID=857335 RepID=A0A272EQF6_9RHOO|nr:flagellar basal-body rod protein FlgG [Candidatus Dactylopiibacterium carminicum]KAF7598533.1 flagellar basal-body rod protein FlgG [Candidatus Dactylopiibacterium carminicum]PAS92337.1 MAG: flagellar basal-body rod protein FlgG [Candidatus Dactylopiibacterium carminicum]PAS95920.1 MAG: flagellar basal-body rod protein FlgG [Candidatus Dactylopiibacterium carminicum]PAS98093.1 MAG: flagellar basal-body rod protein FlgG [Candidatus Dactylopiibacterium carminicum]